MEILSAWKLISKLPARGRLFNLVLKAKVPYTSTIGAEVDVLEKGYAKIHLRDHRAIRNHLNSIHAVALMNLCEATTGLALISILPANAKAILVKFSIEYLKKARGTLTCECRLTIPVIDKRIEQPVETEVTNAQGDVVCRVKAQWLLQPK